MRLLCLHAKHLNGASFKEQIVKLISPIFNNHDRILAFPDGPLKCKTYRHIRWKNPNDHRAWWYEDTPQKTGFDQTVKALKHIVNDIGKNPVDGVLGFSQGASLAAMMATRKMAEEINWRPQFIIVISGKHSNMDIHQSYYDSGFLGDIPSLHMVSRSDAVTDPNDSVKLAFEFEQSVTTHFSGNHILPDYDQIQRSFNLFFNQVNMVYHNPDDP